VLTSFVHRAQLCVCSVCVCVRARARMSVRVCICACVCEDVCVCSVHVFFGVGGNALAHKLPHLECVCAISPSNPPLSSSLRSFIAPPTHSTTHTHTHSHSHLCSNANIAPSAKRGRSADAEQILESECASKFTNMYIIVSLRGLLRNSACRLQSQKRAIVPKWGLV